MRDIALLKNIREFENQKLFSLEISALSGGKNSPAEGAKLDVVLLDELESLVQSIFLRLLITSGEMSKLGHEEYGIGVVNFIGQQDSGATIPHLIGQIKQGLLEDERVHFVSVDYNIAQGKLRLHIQVKIKNGELLQFALQVKE